ncbi:signal peptide protein [Paenibacillus glucanolyticus]|uniref:signal peptide protein n=1 Tax=Paenibacillus glucanolyticus TaxID=59843 RepID=UPI00368E3D0A
MQLKQKGMQPSGAPLRKRKPSVVLAVLILSIMVLALSACGSNESSVFHSGSSEEVSSSTRVPWDYRIVEGTVGDLIGGDMTVLPDNELLPNDNNYATGDKIWTLEFMDAELATDANQRNDIRLSSWQTIKSFKDKKSAQADLTNLKVTVKTDVKLIGVYKTTYKKETRYFAVVELPTGNRIKQPIDEKRFTAMEKKKTVDVVLEEVHDFADYDLAYAKFRGWAD